MNQEDFNSTLQKCRNLCSKSEKCAFDIKQNLIKKEVSDNDIDKIIAILIKEKFIDDARYTEFFVNDKVKFNKWGKIKIRYALNQKGINNKIISNAIDKINNEYYFEILTDLLIQKNKTIKNKDYIQTKAALVRFMSGRGFEYELVMKAIETHIKIK